MKIKKIDIREIEGFRLGNAEDQEGGTGCTVIISEKGAVGGVDVRGGGPATRETDLLKSENTVETVNAVVLSGGSAFGLEAASGVMRALSQKGIGFDAAGVRVPIVTGASLFDLLVGKSNVFPDREMGMEAVDNAYHGTFEAGNHGAGTGATCGKMLGMNRAMKTGLGTFACGDDLVKVGAIAAVNACADIYNGAGNIIAGLRTSDGSAIQGTIKILKGLIHNESETELRYEDIKVKAAEEKELAKIIPVSPVETPAESETMTHESADTHEPSEAHESLVSGPKSDIARAIREAYEQSFAESANHDVTEPASPADEQHPEEQAQEAELSEAVTADLPAADAEQTEAEVATPDELPAEESATEPEPVDIPEQAAEQSADIAAEQTTGTDETNGEGAAFTFDDSEGQIPGEDASGDQAGEVPGPDPFELSEEEKLDMGYDIPFNTTIACLITNAVLTKSQANKLASILHDAYARAIKPVHSTLDGDTIFVLSTCTQEVNFDAFAALATDVMQYAIIDGAQQAVGAYGLPAARDMIHK